jgi:hypothetical protein
MRVAGRAATAALPGELDTDAAIAVGVGGAAIADNNAGQGAARGGAGMDVAVEGPKISTRDAGLQVKTGGLAEE